MEVKKKGRRRTNEAALLKIQQAGNKRVAILRKEWKLATPPGAYLLRKYLKKEYEVRTLEDNSGWLIQRIV